MQERSRAALILHVLRLILDHLTRQPELEAIHLLLGSHVTNEAQLIV